MMLQTLRPSRFVMRLLALAASVCLLIVCALVAVFASVARDLPEMGDLAGVRRQPRIVVVDTAGQTLGIRGQDHGAPVVAENLPEHVVQAFIATEDRNFYYHMGVNPVAILRALIVNLREGGVAQGGSTITQQLAKNLLLTPEKSLERKLQEVLLAVEIERRYSKDEILSLYLNAVYFGNGAYGLEAASRRYFDTAPEDLTLAQSAVLAGLLKAPSRYAPTADEGKAHQRARTVLAAMVDAGYLDRGELDTISLPAASSPVAEGEAVLGYAADYAAARAAEILGAIRDDITIETTIDAVATRATANAFHRLQTSDPLVAPPVQVAALALDEEGAIRVMLGGANHRATPFNRAIAARRQPGSVFKPFVFLTALENGWRPESLIDDTPIRIGDYEPDNYGGTFAGTVPLTEALGRSLNNAAVRLQERVGRHRVAALAARFGLPVPEHPGPSLALGTEAATPLEVAGAYAGLSAGGATPSPYIITRIRAGDGTLLWKRTPPSPRSRLLSLEVRIAFDHMMRAVVETGSGGRARLDRHHAGGKTGTTQRNRDGWFAGYASGMAGVVWLGRDDDGPVSAGRVSLTGSAAPAILWQSMMSSALRDRPARAPLPYVPKPPPSDDALFSHLSRLLGLGGRD